jgi:hypothetical protein
MAMSDQGKRSPRKQRLATQPRQATPGAPGPGHSHAGAGSVPVYDEEGEPLNRAARRARRRAERS